MVYHSLHLLMNSYLGIIVSDNLAKQTMDFANLSNFVALLGGQIKKNQSISGDMADILSNLYLAHSIDWYEDNFKISPQLRDYCIKRLLSENSILFNRVIDNYPLGIRFLLKNMKRKVNSFDYEDNRDLMNEVLTNPKIMDSIKENIYIDESLLKLESLNTIREEEYDKVYQDIISVKEYN